MDKLAAKKMAKIQAKINSSKRKTISVKEFAKKHLEFKWIF